MSFEFVRNVWVDGTDNPYPGGAAGYENDVRGILQRIAGTQTGAAVLSFFSLRHRLTWILPPEITANTRRPDAHASPVNLRGAYLPGRPIRDNEGQIDRPSGRGTGRGTDTTIDFHPTHWRGSHLPFPPDVVLLHEMVHAFRMNFGMMRRNPLGNHLDNTDEMLAIFIENMYRFERGERSMRSNHRSTINSSPNHSMADNPQFHAPMRDFFAMMPTLANVLARLPIAYNPFRDWQAFSRNPHQRRVA